MYYIGYSVCDLCIPSGFWICHFSLESLFLLLFGFLLFAVIINIQETIFMNISLLSLFISFIKLGITSVLTK